MLTADRRDLLAGLTALLGTTVSAPLARALTAGTAPGFAASRAVFTDEQRAMVAAVSERIIPTTDTPGAIGAGVPAFLEMMLADWYEAGDLSNFLSGLVVMDGFVRAQHGKPFAALSPQDQDTALTCAVGGMMPGLSPGFFEQCRQMVILGYYTSEVGCRQERIFLPVPGRYDGAYPYAKVNRVFSS